MRSNFFDPSWAASLSALDDSSLVSVIRSLLAYYNSGSLETLFSSVSSFSGDAAACWKSMVDDISFYVENRKALSAVRKAAGSLGGKKRAERYHRPDGFIKDASLDVGEDKPQVVLGNTDTVVQQSLYSEQELDLNNKARIGAVRVLPSAIAEAGAAVKRSVVQVPVVMGNMVNGVVQLAQASGFGFQPVYQPVMVDCGADESGNLNSWFKSEVFKPGVVPDVSSLAPKKSVRKVKKTDGVASKNKKIVSAVRYSDPPKSPELIDKTPRHRYGEYENVLLSDKEFNTLKKEFPDTWESWIRRCDEYCERNRKEYKNYLMTIRAWARKDAKKGLSSSMVNNSAGSSLGYVPSVPACGSWYEVGNPSADCLDPDDDFGFRTAKTKEELDMCYVRYAYKRMDDLTDVHFDVDSKEFADYFDKFYNEGVELHRKGLL